MTRPVSRILILDDDEGLLMLARRALVRTGNIVITASSTEQARKAIAEEAPDLLIVDYQLDNEESGLSFFRQLQEDGLQIPALMMSGYSDETRLLEALRSGITDIIPKSVNYLESLPAAVERTLAKIHQQTAEVRTQRQTEQVTNHRELANILPHLVWSGLNDGSLNFVNDRWYEYTGLSAEELLGFGWLKQIHPDDQEAVRQAWHQIRQTSGKSASTPRPARFNAEFRLKNQAGDYRWFVAHAATLEDRTGATPYQQAGQSDALLWFGTSTDIEDRKRAEAERESILASERAARGEAERAARIKDDFVATLSHELRTPLNAIVGWTQFLMRDQNEPAKLEKGLEVILRNARVQTQMVDDLLDMSRIMSGKLRLDIAHINLADIIEETISSVQHAAAARDIRLTTILSSAGMIHGDASRLQQIIWNLLTNAIKFTSKGGKVIVTLKKVSSEISITVQDNGRGINPAFLPHVFDRFRQEDSSTSRSVNGLGLGLSLSRQLVEMHGGKISAHSDGENCGATFSIVLPLAAIVDNGRPVSDGKTTAQDKSPQLNGLHILTVEDEPDGRELVQRLLEENGARVTAVASADEALAAFNAEPPDVIVSDIGLPGVDGYDLIRKIREIEAVRAASGSGLAAQRVPAAALTALARGEDRRRALIAGFQTHISKPVDPIELIIVIASLTGRTGMAGH